MAKNYIVYVVPEFKIEFKVTGAKKNLNCILKDRVVQANVC